MVVQRQSCSLTASSQFLRGKPTRFGFNVWVLATSNGETIRCDPYGGAKTKLFTYGLSQGPDVVYGLVEDAKLVPGTKVACDNLFTSLDLLDNMSKKGIGVVYNTHMGGVDLLDNMVSCYAITARNRKWYWALHNWFLNVSFVQAWRLYRKVGMVMGIKDNEKMPLLSFIRSCVEMTIMLHGESNTSHIHTLPALSPSTRADFRRDSGNHIIYPYFFWGAVAEGNMLMCCDTCACGLMGTEECR
ncbi:hypothetical protein E2C01_000036 [Portunus trituberculatus]|uniref:PiggyBac transposable element-derived protein domain-containing protein n=1 Tax=Portunus trituberculatus TaxID=210409 RepID=A0A5B7CF92_PORTR|nr:hypothetical protein [Portunus trituberculatus]